MPIDIGKYNETFKAFADFAKVQLDSGNEKAVARTGAGGAALGGRAIVAATTDRAFAFTRSQADKSANDIARSALLSARGFSRFGDAFNADAISGPDILDDLMN